MSCTDGDECHEFYTAAAASAVRGSCVSLGWTIREEPCAPQYDTCCLHEDGSFENPEMICISSTDTGFEASCNARDDGTYCAR